MARRRRRRPLALVVRIVKLAIVLAVSDAWLRASEAQTARRTKRRLLGAE